MREIVRVERKRILNIKIFWIILLLISIFHCVKNYMDYTVYNSSGSVIISANDNLSELKKNGETDLNIDKLQEVINRRDKGGYASYLRLARIILANYTDKKIGEITKEDLSEFYCRRLLSIKDRYNQMQIFSDAQIDYLLSKATQLDTPIKVGYAEGWRNINNNVVDLMPIILAILSIVLLSVFGKSQKSDMRLLCLSTKYGRTPLIKAKVIAAFEIGTGFYFISVILFTLPNLIVFGVDGLNLPIQSDALYYYSTYNITNLQQYLLNISMGLLAVFVMISIVLFLTSAVDQILSGAALVVFFWVLMLALPNNLLSDFDITHFATNFLPFNMINFSNHYNMGELYSVFGRFVPGFYWIMLIGFLTSFILIVLIVAINYVKLSKKHSSKHI
jgi:hypothetical protein